MCVTSVKLQAACLTVCVGVCVVAADVGPLSHTLFHSESDILKLRENKDGTKKFAFICVRIQALFFGFFF